MSHDSMTFFIILCSTRRVILSLFAFVEVHEDRVKASGPSQGSEAMSITYYPIAKTIRALFDIAKSVLLLPYRYQKDTTEKPDAAHEDANPSPSRRSFTSSHCQS